MMSEMIERAAKAIAEDMFDQEQPGCTSWQSISSGARDACTSAARAAIKALREPTMQMKEAGALSEGIMTIDGLVRFAIAHGQKTPTFDVPPLTQAYQAMIDAALGGGDGSDNE